MYMYMYIMQVESLAVTPPTLPTVLITLQTLPGLIVRTSQCVPYPAKEYSIFMTRSAKKIMCTCAKTGFTASKTGYIAQHIKGARERERES